jgi:hypothetical protein
MPFSEDPNNCTLTIEAGAKVGSAVGAWIDDTWGGTIPESVTGNKVIANKGVNFNGRDVSGAVANLNNDIIDVSDNEAIIDNGMNIHNVYGGYTVKGTVLRNKISIKGGTIIGDSVYGGYSGEYGDVKDNEVRIDCRKIVGSVRGGYVEGDKAA